MVIQGTSSGIGAALRDLIPPIGPAVPIDLRMFVRLGRLVDKLGYGSLWIPEGRGREAFTLAGAIAAVTRQVTLATGVIPVFSRPPTLVAMTVATLDDLSGGRFVLGIGAGHPSITRSGYGLVSRRPVQGIREFVEIVRKSLSGTPVRYDGAVFSVSEFTLEFAHRRPVPIYVGSVGPQMLRLAGEIADGVVLTWVTPDQAREAIAQVRSAAANAGRDPASITIASFIRTCVTTDIGQARAILRRKIALYAAFPHFSRLWGEMGFAGEVAAIRQAWTAGADSAARAVSERMVKALALIGSADVCREGMERYREAGVQLPVVYPLPLQPDRVSSLTGTLEALAPHHGSGPRG